MRTVNIGISHDDDLMITKFGDIKIFVNSSSESSDHGFDLFVSVNLIQTCFLNIQDLTSKGKDRLCGTVSRCLGGTARGISLYDVNLAILRILVRAVCKFSRKRHAIQCRFSSCKVTCFSGCFSGSLCKNRFLNGSFGNCRVLLQENLQLFAHNAVYCASGLAVSQLLLGLSLELRISDLDTYDCCQALSDIITAEVRLTVLKKLVLTCIVIKCVGYRITETGDMCTALRRIDIIYKTVSVLCI